MECYQQGLTQDSEMSEAFPFCQEYMCHGQILWCLMAQNQSRCVPLAITFHSLECDRCGDRELLRVAAIQKFQGAEGAKQLQKLTLLQALSDLF